MPRPRKPPRTAKSVGGLKYFHKLLPLLERLHEVGTERDRAGNRQCHFDHYATLLLLYFFNPSLTSLRSLQEASGLAKVQKKLGIPRTAFRLLLMKELLVFGADALDLPGRDHAAALSQLVVQQRLGDVVVVLRVQDIYSTRPGLTQA